MDKVTAPAAAQMHKLLRRYAAALSIFRWRLGIAAALIVISALTEGFGMAVLLPTLQLAGVKIGGGSSADRFALRIKALFEAIGLHPTLLVIIAIFVAMACVRALLTMFQSLATQSLQEQFCQLLRQRLFEAINHADWLFICRNRSSDFVHAITNEVDRVGAATYYAVTLLSGIIIAGLYMAASLALFPGTTVFAFGCSAVLILLLRRKTRTAHARGQEYSSLSARLYGAVIEHLQALKATRMYGAQGSNCRMFADLCGTTASTSIAISCAQLSAETWFEIGSALMMGAALVIAIKLLSVSPAEILIMLILFARLVPRAKSIQSGFHAFTSMLPSFATVVNLEERCQLAVEPLAISCRPLHFESAVHFKKVSFTYPGAQRSAVREIDLMIPAGKTIAIVGPSGAGKSTIADLLLGLLFPTAGRIVVDDIMLEAGLIHGWRAQIGYVSQDIFLFHDTVRANLLWAQPDADEGRLREALELAAANEFVSRMPNGMDTVISDRGIRLSQGQRQRIGLARALLRRPALLVLDEATNSLDSENEARILGAIERMQSGITTVLIAHRLSTIRGADLIYVIEDGQVIESGGWEALEARLNGHFRHWCQAQRPAA